jgi:two-component system, OmpR family, sensor histidine kinase KdpD
MGSVDRPPERRPGRLIVYLGSAPGVGKTFAALGEAHRRLARGTDVVVGFVETHDRQQTAAQVEGLEVVPRRRLDYRGTTFPEMDVDAVLARRPAVVVVDELAHTNVPGSRHKKRAEDVEELLAAGIEVITTVNIQHLESLNDEVERITGIAQRETVPDEMVRTADQIQLVDMSPDALRRRMAHGNIYRPEQVDASLTAYFRVGNLTALRELALLWLADRVDDQLDDYRRAHRIQETWPAKERIVVAVTGGPESETLIRRGARLAQRAAGAELLAVHVIATDGLHSSDERRLHHPELLASLVNSLGGSFHSVVGEDVSAAVVDFAAGTNATMIVVGVSRHGRLRRLFTGTTGDRIASLAGSIDVHLVTHDQVARRALRRPVLSPLSRGRQAAGWVGALALPTLLTWALHGFADTDQLPLAMLTLLASTVAVALIGGLLPALLAAVIGFLTLNYFFTQPVGTLTVSEPRNLLALVVFVAVAAAVATVVDRASRRAADALRARTEAATMSGLSRSVLTGQDTAEAIVDQLRETFGQDAVSLLARSQAGWAVLASSGAPCAAAPDQGDTTVRVDDDHVLALCGEPLRASDQRVLEAFAVQTGLVLEYRRLRERDERAAVLERAEATSTALLRAVSHDLRTPLATMRASIDGLLDSEVSDADRAELTRAVGGSAEQLERLIDDLLDLSRLQSGLVHPVLRARSLDEVLPLAVAGHPPGAVRLEVDEPAPLVTTDAGLLERVVANLVGNAVKHAPGSPVRVLAHLLPETVEVMVVDRGPGIPTEARERMFEPFQRFGDSSTGGLGLGLAVARGLTEALGGSLSAEDTPGGGLTMVLSLPRAPAATEARAEAS